MIMILIMITLTLIKIEAKVGLLIDKRTNRRIELPVLSECGKKTK